MRTVTVLALALGAVAGPAAGMTLSSANLKPGAAVAAAQIYPRCGGANVSPQLAWSGTPKRAKSLVLTMIDHDVAPNGWSHWIVVDIPPGVSGLAAGQKALPGGAKGVASNFGATGYAGPCPPPGTGVHQYEITIWAMPEASTRIAPDAKARDVEADLARRALAHASIVGSVRR